MNIVKIVLEHEFEWNTVLKLLLASVFGGLIGLEREMKGRPAGLKTFSLVCMGATLIMITNEYINIHMQTSGDAARMAAQVISGIGFLGAGTIMVTGQHQIKGLTTAAALWVTAALGICIGTGFYFGGFLSVCIIYATSYIYRFIDKKIDACSKIIRFYVEGSDDYCLLRLLDHFREKKMRVRLMQRKPENMWYKEHTSAMIEIELPKRLNHEGIIREIHDLEGIRYIEEL